MALTQLFARLHDHGAASADLRATGVSLSRERLRRRAVARRHSGDLDRTPTAPEDAAIRDEQRRVVAGRLVMVGPDGQEEALGQGFELAVW